MKNIMLTHLDCFTFIIPATYPRISSKHTDRHHTYSDCYCGHYDLPWVSGAELSMSFEYVSERHLSTLY